MLLRLPNFNLICLLILMSQVSFAEAPPRATTSPTEEIDFERDIQPVLTRFGCNSGPCHGKQRGQNGFQLSLLGFDSDFDHNALTKETRGRRISFTRPEASLLLMKPAGLTPHGGGLRLPVESSGYQLLLKWIKAGAPREIVGTPSIKNVTVTPTEKIFQHGEKHPLQLTAHYSDGSTRDVTSLAIYQSNEDPIVAVDEHGIVTAGRITGEAAIMARYFGHFAVFTGSVPLAGDAPPPLSLAGEHPIDQLIAKTLIRLGLDSSEQAPDHRFLRRVYIDIIGRMPTAAETEAFLSRDDTGSESTSKRVALVDDLLSRPEYAEHWANKWADLLRPNPYRVGIKATLNYDAWIRNSFRTNQPYDQFVRELVAARGSTFRNGNVTLFRDRRSPDELTTIVSQLFLGIRLECAKCHHHPFEVYGQEDFYSFAAYFAEVGRKGTGVSPPISGSEEFIFSTDKGEVRHPLTNEVLSPKPLYGEAPEIPEGSDPREALAQWITSVDNPYFSQTMANRIWTDLMTIGLVNPVGDLRATNPASNPELLKHLGDYLAQNEFDLKKLIRHIVLSKSYSLSSQPTEKNQVDTRYFSRHFRERLRAEVLLDSVIQITKVPESFSAMAPGTRAKELWTHRIGSLFLDAYGRPDPNQDPPCERMSSPTVVQTLHLMNSENLFKKVTSKDGWAAELSKSELPPEEIVQQLYLGIYSRYPNEKELDIGVKLYDNVKAEDDPLKLRQQNTEDLMWALMNTPEFVFKD
ncbi:MAG: DUF1549 domain-containing protein [Planctomicrobium sp.]|nr:DUF1549 domain-containing protein [Planctomicrobium sp.]